MSARPLFWAGTLLACLQLSGCSSTLRYAFDDSPNPCSKTGYIYGGTRIDGMLIGNSFTGPDRSAALGAFGLVDLPFSLVMDTLLLPLAIPLESHYHSACQQQKVADTAKSATP